MKTPPAPTPSPAPSDDKKKVLQILGPALAVAGVVGLIAIVAGTGGSPSGTGTPVEVAGVKFPHFPLDNPEWKPAEGGLKVWDVKEGEGDPCPAAATVTVHYTGWLTDGTKFDSSRDKGKPATFSLNEVIKGWTKGLPGMKVGGVCRLLIPWAMAYGASGRQPSIPPKADLVFEVEMLSFK